MLKPLPSDDLSSRRHRRELIRNGLYWLMGTAFLFGYARIQDWPSGIYNWLFD